MNKRIPITIPFEDDELLTSWELRMAKANLYNNRNDFSKEWSKGQLLARDSFGFSRDLLLGSFYKDNQFMVYEKHSLYPFFAPFFNKQKQEKILYAQRTGFDKESPIGKWGLNVPSYKYCPECAKEDPRIYLHRAHQLPGVDVCHLHGCRLIKLDKKYNGEEMFNIVMGEEPNYFIEPIDVAHAQFAKEFMDSAFDITVKDIHKMIEIRVKELKLETIDSVRTIFSMDHKPIYDRDAKYILSNPQLLSEKFLMKNLITIFGDMFNFKRIYKRYIKKEAPKVLPEEIVKQGYELISPYKRNLMEIRHKGCGQSFLITEHGLKELSLRCPDCTNLTNKELYERMFNSIANNEFTLLSPFKGIGQKVKIKHSCGHKFKSNPIEFYYNERGCPKCLSRLTLDRAQEKVDQVDPTWKVLNYTTLENKAEFLHTTCNHTVERRFADFLRKGMSCPTCKKLEKKSKTPEFVEKMKGLVEDEYELVGDFMGDRRPVKIRHNTCGLVTEYPRASYFLNGQRCPLCHGTISQNDISAYVSARSKGAYMVSGFLPSKDLEILNTVTDEVYTLKKKLVLQELARPTASEILPCNTNEDIERPISVGGKFFKELQKHFSGKAFKARDIMDRGWTKNQTQRNLRRLMSLDLVKKDEGFYSLVQDYKIEDKD